jgi:hypothetical protein
MEDVCIARDCFHPVVVVTTLGPLCELHAKRLCLEPDCKNTTRGLHSKHPARRDGEA